MIDFDGCFDECKKLFYFFARQILVRFLPAAEHQVNLHVTGLFQKLFCLFYFDFQVVELTYQTDADSFEAVFLFFWLVLFFLLFLLVLEFAKTHNAYHGCFRVKRNLNNVDSALLGNGSRLFNSDKAEIFVAITNGANVPCRNSIIDAEFCLLRFEIRPENGSCMNYFL